MNPDPVLSKGSTRRTVPPSGSSSSGTARGRVNPPICHFNPPPPRLRVYMLYCAKAIILIPTLLHLPSLCFANVLSHIILHTHSNHWALGTVQEVIVAFVRVAPPPPFLLKGAAPPCQLSSYNCLQTQGPNDRIYSTWKHNYSPWFNCYCVNGLLKDEKRNQTHAACSEAYKSEQYPLNHNPLKCTEPQSESEHFRHTTC